MAWPYVIMAVAAAVSAGVQWYNSEKGRNASKDERKKVQELIDKLQAPNFDPSMLEPEDYAVVRKHIPVIAGFIEETRPELVKADSEGAKAGRAAEMAALDRYRQLGQTGDDMDSRIMRQEALRDAQIQNQGQQASIQQSMAQRGMSGSGMELVASLMGQQGSNELASRQAERAAMDAYNRRLMALQQGADLGGKIRADDIALETLNTNRINDFNQRFAKAKQEYGKYVANTHNEADRFNIGQEQHVANLNTTQNNEYAKRYQDQSREEAWRRYGAEVDKVAMASGQYNAAAAAHRQDAADKNQLASGIASMVMQGAASYQESQEREKDREAMRDGYSKRYG